MKILLRKSTLQDFGLAGHRLALFFLVSILSAAFEGFGLAMLLPVMQYIEKGSEVAGLGQQSPLWGKIIWLFSSLHLPITLAGLLGVVLSLIMFRIVLVYVRQYYIAFLTQEMFHVSRCSLLRAWLYASYKVISRTSSGYIVNLSTNETQRAGAGINAILSMVSTVPVLFGLWSVLFFVSARLTLLVTFLLPLAGFVVWIFTRRSKVDGYSASGALKEFYSEIMERIIAFRLIKLSSREEQEYGKIHASSLVVRNLLIKLRTYGARVDLIMEPLVATCAFSILYFATMYFGLSLSEVGIFIVILLRLMPLAQGLLREWQSFATCQGALSAVVNGLADARAAAEPAAGGRPFAGLSQGIRLEGVTFSYEGADRPALDQVSLDLPAGRMTALVGPSGAGKTTLADLLPRLQEPQSGVLCFDGVPAREYDLSSLRRGIAFVSQEAILFNDSVRANLAFVRPEADDAAIWTALGQAKAREFVEALPQGLDTPLGERGACLSGGQRQRIALARALLQGAPVIVLDEPTSALDSESELAIQQSIEDLRRAGATTLVVIAHRLSTTRSADRIVVLRAGRVEEQGTHRELIVNQEWYARVQGIQSGTGRDDNGPEGVEA